jgi:zeaxanthin glucosyltransferase
MELIQQVLTNLSYRDKANYFKDVIAEKHGLDIAADAIDDAFKRHMAEGRELARSLHG